MRASAGKGSSVDKVEGIGILKRARSRMGACFKGADSKSLAWGLNRIPNDLRPTLSLCPDAC